MLGHPAILGIHDLIVHDYGPGRLFASVHAEVDGAGDVFEIHDSIDNIENECLDELGILLTIHMDPVKVGDPATDVAKERLKEIVSGECDIINVHDIRVVSGPTHTNVVFDVVIAHECTRSNGEIREMLQSRMRGYDPGYNCVITFDRSYV